MEISLMRMPIFFVIVFVFLMFPNSSHCATILVDGINEWKNPTVNIGDSIIFKHKDHYNLYIFRSESAFNLCNFTQSTRLSSSSTSSSYIWKPSRLGNYYFSFNNGTSKPCLQGQKLVIKVIPLTPAPAPEISVEPPESPPVTVVEPPTPGGVAQSSPAFPWPFRPREKSGGPSGAPAPVATETTAMAPVVPGGVGGEPFIDSNPAIPLPTGEVDSDTFRPLPTSANNNHAPRGMKVEGLVLGFLIPKCIVILFML